jgi:signal transduction histidine kinase
MSGLLHIRLDLRDGLLREALADLLGAAGHRVRPSGAAGEDGVPDLVICAEAPEQAPVGRHATLALRPSGRHVPDADPGAALRRALASGGLVVWAPPLDARRLFDALDPGTRPASRAEEAEHFAVFATCAEPWLLVDAAAVTARPLNRAAAEASEDPAWSDEIARVVAEPEGLRRLTSASRGDGVLWWWSLEAGVRLVAWLAWPRIHGLDDLGHLRALADLGRISSTFAHEVRNPLAALTGALALLGGTLEPTERAEVLQLAGARLQGLRSMLDDTLRLVRAFRGEPQPVDLAEVVASALTLAQSDPAFRGVRLTHDVPEPCPEALSYAEPLRQALTNLLLNAAEAQGGRGEIVVEVVPRHRRVVVAVEDRGPGVAAAIQDRIFEPFWTTKSGGTGLGLVFVRRVAEASHGCVRVGGGRGGTGARFEIELPARPMA